MILILCLYDFEVVEINCPDSTKYPLSCFAGSGLPMQEDVRLSEEKGAMLPATSTPAASARGCWDANFRCVQ